MRVLVILLVGLLFLLGEQLHEFLFKKEYELGVISIGEETFMPNVPRCPQFFPKQGNSTMSLSEPRFSLVR